MPKRSKITQLPPEIKAELDKKLIEGSFSDYEGVTEWLNGRLAEEGLELTVSISGMHRYGQTFENKISAIKIATEQAKAIAEASSDEEGAMTEALIRLVQQQAFDILVNMQGDDEEAIAKVFPKMGVMIAKLSKASVDQKKFAAEVRKKATAAADDVAKIVKKGGLSEDKAEEIRKRILGIV